MYPHLLTADPTVSILPILSFLLDSADIPSPLLRRSLLRCPRLLLVLSVDKTLVPKLAFLTSLGISYRDAVTMVMRSPAIFTFSIQNNLRRKVEFLEGEMRRGVGELRGFPHYFSFSLDRRIRRRYGMMVESGVDRKMGLEEEAGTRWWS